MPSDSTPEINAEFPVHVSFTPDHLGESTGELTGLYEAWVISEMPPPSADKDIERLRSALDRQVMRAINRLRCAHVDHAFEIINPYVTRLSKKEMFKRYGAIPNNHEVNRLAYYVKDGYDEQLKHS